MEVLKRIGAVLFIVVLGLFAACLFVALLIGPTITLAQMWGLESEKAHFFSGIVVGGVTIGIVDWMWDNIAPRLRTIYSMLFSDRAPE